MASLLNCKFGSFLFTYYSVSIGATNVIPHKTKFKSRVIMCCFHGYNQFQKAYKLYDLTDKKIVMSRYVIL